MWFERAKISLGLRNVKKKWDMEIKIKQKIFKFRSLLLSIATFTFYSHPSVIKKTVFLYFALGLLFLPQISFSCVSVYTDTLSSAMAKKRIPIDYIPQHSQQRRSTISKRRTDFSSLMRTFDCLFNPGRFLFFISITSWSLELPNF